MVKKLFLEDAWRLCRSLGRRVLACLLVSDSLCYVKMACGTSTAVVAGSDYGRTQDLDVRHASGQTHATDTTPLEKMMGSVMDYKDY